MPGLAESPAAPRDRSFMPGAIWITAGIAAAAHLIFISLLPGQWAKNQSADYFEYNEPVARNLLSGRGLTDTYGRPAIHKPPGQSLILASLFALSEGTGVPEPIVLRLYIVVITAAGAVALYAAARQLVPPAVALLSAGLWATFPFHLWIAKQPNTEVPFMALFFAIVWLVIREINSGRLRPRVAIAIGLAAGISSLIRPAAIVLSGVFALWVYLAAQSSAWRHRLTFATLIIASNLIAVLPWEIWAHNRTGKWIPLSNHGTDSLLDGLTFGVKGRQTALLMTADLRPLMQDMLDRQSKGEFRTSRPLLGYLAQQFAEQPNLMMRLVAVKMCRAWFGTNEQWFEGRILALELPYLGLAVWGAAAMLKLGPSQRGFVILVLLVLVYFWAMTVMALSIVRYMLPVLGLFMIPAAAALVRVPPVGRALHIHATGSR